MTWQNFFFFFNNFTLTPPSASPTAIGVSSSPEGFPVYVYNDDFEIVKTSMSRTVSDDVSIGILMETPFLLMMMQELSI